MSISRDGILRATLTASLAVVVILSAACNDSNSPQTEGEPNIAPSNLRYSANPAVYSKGSAITANSPKNDGGGVSSYAISPSLPTGLSFDASSGVISGSPSVVSAASSYSVTASNSAGSTTTNLQITVNDLAPTGLQYASAVTGVGVSLFESPSNSGGTITSYLVTPALPAGLSMDSGTGVISGIPTVAAAATTYTVTGTNSGGSTSTTFTITVSANTTVPALSYVGAAGLSGPVETAMNIAPTTLSNGGSSITNCAVSSGALPAGFTVNLANCVISGTPTTVGTFNASIVATNSVGSSLPASVSIVVNSIIPTLSYSGASGTTGTIGNFMSISPTTLTMGGATTTCSVSSGSLPSGFAVNSSTCVISGTPSSSGNYTAYIVATNSAGSSPSAQVAITVSATTKPGSFSITSAVPGYDQATITWGASSGATSYTLKRGTSSGSYPTVVTASATSPYIDTGLTDGVTYYYTVTAVSGASNTDANAEQSVTPTWTQLQGTTGIDTFAHAAATDASGNALVAGGTLANVSSGAYNMYVTKYNPSGILQWTHQLGAANSLTVANGVASDSSSDVYVTGNTPVALDGNTLMGSSDYFLTKYSSSGTKQWTIQFGGVSSKITDGNAIAVDVSDNVYITGSTDGRLDGGGGTNATGTKDFFLAKYNTSGSQQWVRQLGVASATTEGLSVAVDPSGNVYVAGYTTGGLDGNTVSGAKDLFVSKYDDTGTKQWTRQLGAAGNLNYTIGYGVTTDSLGDVYVTGGTTGTLDGQTLTGYEDIFLVKYDTSGSKQWTRLHGGQFDYARGYSAARDSSDNIYIGGLTTGALAGQPLNDAYAAAIVKYDSTGARQWTRLLSVAHAQTWGYGIATNASSEVYVAGYTTGSLDGIPLTGTKDACLAKYDTSGVKQ